jgi:sugar phosphate isomerase/epimerase
VTAGHDVAWGFVSNCLGPTSLDEVVTTARELGFSCVEVGPAVKRDLAAFKRVAADGEIRIHSFIYGRNVLTPSESLRDEYAGEIRRLLDLAILLGVPQITMAMGVRPDLSFDENLDASLAFWHPYLEEGARSGVRFAIEFCPTSGNFALGPWAWRQLFARSGIANLGLNYDPSHLMWQMIDAYRPVSEFADHIFSIHAKDTHIKRDALAEHGITTPYLYREHAPHGLIENRAPWWEFRIPGEGDIDWARLMGLLRASEYRGAVLIELESGRYAGNRARVIDGLQRSLAHLRRAWEEGGLQHAASSCD